MLIDLSHSVEHGMITYKGLPAPVICDFLSRIESRKHYAPGVEFHIGKIEMVANTGTYMDSPFHRFEHGDDLAQLPLDKLADVPGVLVRVDYKGRAINLEDIRGLPIKGRAVLFNTNWSVNWRTDRYFEGHPFVAAEAARYLVDSGVTIVGIDSYNIDDTADLTRPVHTELLGAGIPIVEHMCNLQHIPQGAFRFFSVPVKVRQFGTFPVRAFAISEEK